MTIYVIATLGFLLHTGFGGGRVTATLFAVESGASTATIGVLMSLLGLFPTLLAVHLGRLTDRIGVRQPALIGCIGVLLGLLVPALYPTMASLYVTVLLIGTSFTCFQVAVTSLVGALGPPEQRTRNYSILSLGYGAASSVGPLVAGFSIDGMGHRWTFALLAVWTLTPLLLILLKPRLLPELRTAGGSVKGGGVGDLLRIPRLRDTFIVGGVLSAAWDLYQFMLPIYAHSIGLSASVIGMILATFSLAIFAVRAALPAMARRYGESQLITTAIFLSGAAFVMFPLFQDPWLLALASAVLGTGVGCGQPLTLSLIYTLAPQGRGGEAAGVRVSVNHMTQVTVPLVFGAAAAVVGYAPLFLANAALMIGCGVVAQKRYMR